jgi:integrase/recombinase XerD
MTPHEQIDQYERSLRARGLSERTVTQRGRRMRRLQDDFGDLAQVTDEQAAMWLGQFSGWTRITYHNDLCSIFDWLRRAGVRGDHPVRGLDKTTEIKKPPAPRPKPHPFSRAEETRIFTAAVGDVRAWLLLARWAGLRAGEIAQVDGSDITDGWFRVHGKGGTEEDVPTHPVLWELAQTYPRRGQWFNLSPKELTRQGAVFLHGLGFDGGLHRMRATFGTRMIENQVPLSDVQRLMRHRSLQSTQHYLGTDESRLRSAIEAA